MLVKRYLGVLFLAASTTLAATVVAGQEPAEPAAPAARNAVAELKKLAWICGTWVVEQNGTTTEEHWRPLQGSTLMGSSHLFDAEKTYFFEYLRIGLSKGRVAYIASPGGAPPTTFPLKELGEGFVVFENPEHDHPQRIRYERTEKGLTATVGQLDGTREQKFVFETR